MSRWLRFVRHAKREIQVYRCVAAHADTPALSRWLLSAAIGYALLPFDLIPDWIPVVGHLDDAVIVPGLIWLALRRVPRAVLDDCRTASRASVKDGEIA